MIEIMWRVSTMRTLSRLREVARSKTMSPLNGTDFARRANHFVFSEMACPAPFAKIFPFSPDPNQMHIQTVPSHRGAIARRHERGAGCGGSESVRRCQGMAGRVDKARELTNGTQTNDALADGEVVWF